MVGIATLMLPNLVPVTLGITDVVMTSICDALEGTTMVVGTFSIEELWTDVVTVGQLRHAWTSSKQKSVQMSNSRMPYCCTEVSPNPSMTSLTCEAEKYSWSVWSGELEVGRLLPASWRETNMCYTPLSLITAQVGQ